MSLPDEQMIREAARQTVAQMIGRNVKPGESFISSGLIDSLSILKLITQLEKKLGVHMPTDGLQPDDFDTVDLIVETVQRVGQPTDPSVSH